jgi:hypothetical protein
VQSRSKQTSKLVPVGRQVRWRASTVPGGPTGFRCETSAPVESKDKRKKGVPKAIVEASLDFPLPQQPLSRNRGWLLSQKQFGKG